MSVRFTAPLTGVSPRGDFGFFMTQSMIRSVGHDGELPARRVFLHVRQVPKVDRLTEGLWVDSGATESARKHSALAAHEPWVIPRVWGFLDNTSPNGNYSFAQHETLRLDDFDDESNAPLPQQDVFVVARHLQVRRLADGMRVSFVSIPSRREPGTYVAELAKIRPITGLFLEEEFRAPRGLFRVVVSDFSNPRPAPEHSHAGDFACLDDALVVCRNRLHECRYCVFDDIGKPLQELWGPPAPPGL